MSTTDGMSVADLRIIDRFRLSSGMIVAILLGILAYCAIPTFIPYKLEVCGSIVMIVCGIACIMWAEKNKVIAGITALTPIIPMDLIYLDQIDLDHPERLIVRMIPIVGNCYDLYRIFISKSLKPTTGWSSDLM